jgi:hypothetical protein
VQPDCGSVFPCAVTVGGLTTTAFHYVTLNSRGLLLMFVAVGLLYEDRAAELNSATERVLSEAQPPDEWSEARLPPFSDISSDEVRASLAKVMHSLHLPAAEVGGLGMLLCVC